MQTFDRSLAPLPWLPGARERIPGVTCSPFPGVPGNVPHQKETPADMDTTITALLLADGWHDLEQLHWPQFHGQPGYAAITPSGRWLIGPTSAIQAVRIDPDTEALAEALGAALTEAVAERRSAAGPVADGPETTGE